MAPPKLETRPAQEGTKAAHKESGNQKTSGDIPFRLRPHTGWNPHAMEALYNERLNDIEHIINIQSGDDPDLKQEGLIGAFLAMRGNNLSTLKSGE